MRGRAGAGHRRDRRRRRRAPSGRGTAPRTTRSGAGAIGRRPQLTASTCPGPVQDQQLQVAARPRTPAGPPATDLVHVQRPLAPAEHQHRACGRPRDRAPRRASSASAVAMRRGRPGSRRAPGCRSSRRARAARNPCGERRRTTIATVRRPAREEPVRETRARRSARAARRDVARAGPRAPAARSRSRPSRRRRRRPARAGGTRRIERIAITGAFAARSDTSRRTAPPRPRRSGTRPRGPASPPARRGDPMKRDRCARDRGAARRASASAGKTCPAVPPPAITTFTTGPSRGATRPAGRACAGACDARQHADRRRA